MLAIIRLKDDERLNDGDGDGDGGLWWKQYGWVAG